MDLLPDILKVGSGWLVGWFAHLWACRRDDSNRTRKAKDEFRKVIAEWNGKISTRENDLVALHAESITPISTAVYTLKDFISADEFHTLRTVLTAYQGILPEQLDMIHSHVAQLAATMQKEPEPPLAPDLLRTHLERLAGAVR